MKDHIAPYHMKRMRIEERKKNKPIGDIIIVGAKVYRQFMCMGLASWIESMNKIKDEK